MAEIHVARRTFAQSYPDIFLSSSGEKIREIVAQHIIDGVPLPYWTIGVFDAFTIPSEIQGTVAHISKGGPQTFQKEVARLFEVPVENVVWNPADTLAPRRLAPSKASLAGRLREAGWLESPEYGIEVDIPSNKLLVQVKVLSENGTGYGCPSYHHDEKGINMGRTYRVCGGNFYKLIDA